MIKITIAKTKKMAPINTSRTFMTSVRTKMAPRTSIPTMIKPSFFIIKAIYFQIVIYSIGKLANKSGTGVPLIK